MPGSPVPDVAWALRAAYRAAWGRVQAEQAALVDDPTALRRRGRLTEMAQRIAHDMGHLDDLARRWIERAVLGSHTGGGAQITGQLTGDYGFTQPHSEAVRRIAGDTLDDLLRATRFVDTTTKTLIRKVTKRETLDALIVGRTPQESARALTHFLEREGIHAIRYANGARVGLGAYADMAIRTATGNAHNLGTLEAGEAHGVEWWRVLDGPKCGWVSHDDEELALNMIVSTGEAKRHPLSHPNCRRAFAAAPGARSRRHADRIVARVSDEQISAQLEADARRGGPGTEAPPPEPEPPPQPPPPASHQRILDRNRQRAAKARSGGTPWRKKAEDIAKVIGPLEIARRAMPPTVAGGALPTDPPLLLPGQALDAGSVGETILGPQFHRVATEPYYSQVLGRELSPGEPIPWQDTIDHIEYLGGSGGSELVEFDNGVSAVHRVDSVAPRFGGDTAYHGFAQENLANTVGGLIDAPIPPFKIGPDGRTWSVYLDSAEPVQDVVDAVSAQPSDLSTTPVTASPPTDPRQLAFFAKAGFGRTEPDWAKFDRANRRLQEEAVGGLIASPRGRRLALFDYLTGNIDRHFGNILVDYGGSTLWGIDHELTFMAWRGGNRVNVFTAYWAERLPHEEIAAAAAAIEANLPRLEAMAANMPATLGMAPGTQADELVLDLQDGLNAMMARLRYLQDTGAMDLS